MKQVQRILLVVVLILTCIVVYKQKTRIDDLYGDTVVKFELVENDIHNLVRNTILLGNEVAIYQQELNLSVFDSCGIITDGRGGGSCVAIGANLILTAKHCLGHPGSWIEVGRIKYEIDMEWGDPVYDVGFVRIKGEVPYLELGLTPELLQTVYLIGCPYGFPFENTITKGVISHLNRTVYDHVGLIQTDAEGAHGSSGGPLLNTTGQIIGICVAGPVDGGGITLCEPVIHIQEALGRFFY